MKTRYHALRVFAPIIGRMSWLSYPAATTIGSLAWYVSPSHRRHLLRNVVPFSDGDRARAITSARRAYRNIARSWVDVATLPHRDMPNFAPDHLTIVNGERLAVIEQPGPVIVVSAHMGNAELALQALTVRGRSFVALVEKVQPPKLGEYLLRMRQTGGGQFELADFKGIRACLEALRSGGTVAIMADRDIQGNGICASLGGRPVKLPRGPWELARKTGATVLPVFATRLHKDHFVLEVEEPFKVGCANADADVDVRAAVDRWALVLEAQLRRHPGQWIVLEDFWRAHRCG